MAWQQTIVILKSHIGGSIVTEEQNCDAHLGTADCWAKQEPYEGLSTADMGSAKADPGVTNM